MKSVEISEIEKYYKIELIHLIEDERPESKFEFYKNKNTYSLNSKKEIIKLNLKDNILKDLKGLSKVKDTVTHLNLSETRIDNIETLSNFKNLIFLDLSTNNIEDINSIKELKKLEFLYLDNNKINKIPELNLPKLNELFLNSNEIEDITNLKKLLNLDYLNISNNKIKNIDIFKDLENIKHLDLRKNNISNIAPLSNFKSFYLLDLSSNEINDISPLSNIVNIENRLILEENGIEDINPLKSIEIGQLFIGDNKIIDLSSLYFSLKTKKIQFINVNNSPNLLYPIEEIAKKGEERIVEWFNMIFENIEKCKQKIIEVKNSGKTSLDIGMMGITNLNLIPNLFEFEELEELILSNHYAKYNDEGQYWEKVESENNFYPNNIYNIPNDIKKLKKLKKLIIGGDWKKGEKWNRWRIKDLTYIFSLKELEYLNVSNNNIERITITNRVKLPKLKVIYLNNNKLNTFYTLTKFPNLEELYLSNNELTRVTNLENILTLKTIDLHGNKITSIKPLLNILEKTEINITNTKWGKHTINIQDNPLKEPNYETINTGKEAVIRYFESVWGKVVNKEIKLILVGNSEVGKTTLVKYLDVEKDLGQAHEATHWMIEKDISSKHIIKKINEKCNIRVFDFGGQDYYHDTHHIFFTGNTVYLLLWEKSSNNLKLRTLRQKVNGKDKNIETQDYPVKYWLESIKHFIKVKSNIVEDNNITYDYDSNLLLIQNKVSTPEEIEHLNNFELTNKKNYPFISDFINIDILRDKRNLEHLDYLLNETINEMEIVGSNILEYQHIIRNKLNSYKAKQILDFNEFIEYCNINLKRNISNDETKDLCSYLKQLGLIFFLKDYSKIYLNKEWVFESIYKVLDGLLDLEGEFDRDYICKVLNMKSENSLIDGLIALMFDFKIIFHNPLNKKFIAPLYLPKKPSDGVNLFLLENRIPFRRFEYNGFIHKTIILDFFCEYGKKSISDEKKYYYWKDGLIIKDDLMSQILYVKFDIGNEHGNAFIDIFKLNDKDKEDKFVNEVINFIKEINNKFFKINEKDIEDKKVDIEDYYEEMVTIDNVDFVSLKLLNENLEKGKFIFSERKFIKTKEKIVVKIKKKKSF
uniref:leucine-rich repeat domain-containing protein n=1 Tax=Flavobacterium sp. TaxID=239 RepID=UPI00404767BA